MFIVESFYSARNARIASAVLAKAIPSVRPSVRLLLHGSRSVAVSQTLRRSTRNEITEPSLLVIFNRWHHLYSEGGHHVGHRPTF